MGKPRHARTQAEQRRVVPLELDAAPDDGGMRPMSGAHHEHERHPGVEGHPVRPRRVGHLAPQYEDRGDGEDESRPLHHHEIGDQGIEVLEPQDQGHGHDALGGDGDVWRGEARMAPAQGGEAQAVPGQGVGDP